MQRENKKVNTKLCKHGTACHTVFKKTYRFIIHILYSLLDTYEKGINWHRGFYFIKNTAYLWMEKNKTKQKQKRKVATCHKSLQNPVKMKQHQNMALQ